MAYMALATVQQARHAFFDRQQLPVGQVADTVLKSWIRSTDSGLDESRMPAAVIVPQELEESRQRRETFRRICAPEIEALYSAARDMEGIVALADENGRVLDVVGDTSFAGRVKSPTLIPGIDWSEQARGTNAIGTALIEKRAVTINGAEHFIRDYSAFSCVAMPVLDVRGQIQGVINLTMPATSTTSGAMGMVRLAVEQVEHRLAVTGFDDCDVLRFHTNAAFLGTAREGLLILRDGIVVGSNRNGLGMISHHWSDLDSLHFNSVFEPVEDETHLRSHTGRIYACEWQRSGPLSLTARIESLAEMEEAVIRRVLDAHNGNITAAARHLGVHRSTLYRRLKAA